MNLFYFTSWFCHLLLSFHFFHCIGRMPWRKSELIHYILWIVLEYKSSPDHSILEMPPLGSNHYSILEAAGHSPAFQSSQFLIPPPTLSISLPHNIYKYMEYHKASKRLARYSPRATTAKQQGTKWTGKAFLCPRKHILGQKWPLLGQKS